jgi:molybdopterin converting factor subunit 1
MPVKVRLFARLRDIAGAAELERGATDGATIATLWQGLVQEHPALGDYTRIVACARNAEFARMDTRVADGDEVAFLPPVSGG